MYLLKNSPGLEILRNLVSVFTSRWAATEIFVNDDEDTHVISVCSITGKCKLEYVLWYLSIWVCTLIKWMIYFLTFDWETQTNTDNTKREVRQKEIKAAAYSVLLSKYHPRRFCKERSRFPASFKVFSVAKEPTRVSNLLAVYNSMCMPNVHEWCFQEC